jgi:hypothetical protein
VTPCPSCTTPFVPERRKLHLCPACTLDRDERARLARERRAAKKNAVLRCLRCQEQYVRVRSSGHFCEGCVDAIDRGKATERMRTYRKHIKELVEEVKLNRPDLEPLLMAALKSQNIKVSDVLTERHAEAEWAPEVAKETLEEVGLANEWGAATIATDQLPSGAKTALGPDEGRSTFFADLRGWLDTLSFQAAAHLWWSENPHWAWELGDASAVQRYNLAPGLRCGEQQGTEAGYQRHQHAKEMPCPACTDAKREFMREYMRARRSAAVA